MPLFTKEPSENRLDGWRVETLDSGGLSDDEQASPVKPQIIVEIEEDDDAKLADEATLKVWAAYQRWRVTKMR